MIGPEETRREANTTTDKVGCKLRVLKHLQSVGERGATDHETAAALGMCIGTAQCRRSDLMKESLVGHAGKTRLSNNGVPMMVFVVPPYATSFATARTKFTTKAARERAKLAEAQVEYYEKWIIIAVKHYGDGNQANKAIAHWLQTLLDKKPMEIK